jgi:hypothetical protein
MAGQLPKGDIFFMGIIFHCSKAMLEQLINSPVSLAPSGLGTGTGPPLREGKRC